MRSLLTSILSLTKDDNRCSHEEVCRAAKLPLAEAQMQLRQLSDRGILELKNNVVVASSEQRLGLALKALDGGADFEKICRLLSWQEFEDITVKSLEANGFSTIKHLAFKANDRRREIDVVGLRYMLVICLDCKHWMKGLRGAVAEEIAAKQVERVESLASDRTARNRLGISAGNPVYFIPVVVSLIDAGPKFIGGVPIVPALKLNSFLSSIDPYVDGLLTIKAKQEVGQNEHLDSSWKRR